MWKWNYYNRNAKVNKLFSESWVCHKRKIRYYFRPETQAEFISKIFIEFYIWLYNNSFIYLLLGEFENHNQFYVDRSCHNLLDSTVLKIYIDPKCNALQNLGFPKERKNHPKRSADIQAGKTVWGCLTILGKPWFDIISSFWGHFKDRNWAF